MAQRWQVRESLSHCCPDYEVRSSPSNWAVLWDDLGTDPANIATQGKNMCILSVLFYTHFPEQSGCFQELLNPTQNPPYSIGEKNASVAPSLRRLWLRSGQQCSCHCWFSAGTGKHHVYGLPTWFPVNSRFHMWLLMELTKHKLVSEKETIPVD